MEHVVGIRRYPEVALRALLEERLPRGAALSGKITIRKEAHGYLWIETADAAQVLLLAQALADIMIETVQIRFLLGEIQAHCAVDDAERCAILLETVRQIWLAEGREGMERQKEIIARQIARCLLEEGPLLSLDGLLQFRMQSYLARWRAAIDEVIESRRLRREQQEFICLLRYFVEQKPPAEPVVFVTWEAGEYLLQNAMGDRLAIMKDPFFWEEDSTPEERLLSWLVELAPGEIRLLGVEDAMLVQLIEHIFVGRVHR